MQPTGTPVKPQIRGVRTVVVKAYLSALEQLFMSTQSVLGPNPSVASNPETKQSYERWKNSVRWMQTQLYNGKPLATDRYTMMQLKSVIDNAVRRAV